jgi:hypothetical protein
LLLAACFFAPPKAQARIGSSTVLTTMQNQQYSKNMAKTAGRAARTGERRVPRTYRLPIAKIEAAQRALGAPTATETIERALDLVVFQQKLIRGTRAMLGVVIEPSDPEQ